MDKATIFYNHQAWLDGADKIFDVRFDAQMIPAGSVVCGFAVWDNDHKQIEETIDLPAMTPAQGADFSDLIEATHLELRADAYFEEQKRGRKKAQ